MSESRTAVVTGASRGIGRAIALRLATEYEVVAVARTGAELQTLAAEIAELGGRCTPLVLDVTDNDAVRQALTPVAADVLVNNAGVGVTKPFVELSLDEWRLMWDVNINAIYHCTHTLLPGMIARGRGHIVNISSIVGRTPLVNGATYSATKHALLGLSESLMLEVRDHGVRVSVVMPGSVATGFFGSTNPASWKLRPEDVAESVAHLLSVPKHALVFSLEVRASQPPVKRT
jgi:short-subunit dehydrogenase